MAIIRSLAIGKGRKSAGNLTFRTVRGRTIVSEKVSPRPITRGDGMTEFEARFKLISMFIGAHRADINVSFDKSKFGSQGNYFYKLNKTGLETAIAGLIPTAESATISAINTAITTYATAHPDSIYRVKRTGYESKYLTGEWKSSDNPVAPVSDLKVTSEGKNIPAIMAETAGGRAITVAELAETKWKITGTGIGSDVVAIAFQKADGSVATGVSTTGLEVTDNSISFTVDSDPLGDTENASCIKLKDGVYIQFT